METPPNETTQAPSAQTSAPTGDVTTFTEAERVGMEPRPQVGFTVLYRKGTQKPRPAIVMEVHSDMCVDLVVFGTGYPTVVGLTSVEKIDGKAGVGVGWFWPDWL